jgi:acetone carboxylase gamma subunit
MESTREQTRVSTKVVPYEIPSIISSEKLDETEEALEVLSYAFHLVSKEYFEAKNKIEDDMADIEQEEGKTKRYYALTGSIIVFSLIVTVFLANFYMSFVAIIGVIGSVAVYLKLRKLNQEYVGLVQELESLKINKKITFLSKLYLPVYLMPYKEGVMIFDALGKMPSVSFQLYNLKTDQLEQAFNQLKDKISNFEQKILERDTLSVEEIAEYDQTVKDSKTLEKPIFEVLEKIANLSEDLQRNDLTFQIYGPQTDFSQSIRQVFEKTIHEITEQNDLPTVNVKFTMEDARQIVENMRGVKATALEADIVAACNRWKQEIANNQVLDRIKTTLMENIEYSNELFDRYSDSLKMSIYDYICPECAKEKLEDVKPKYKLVTTFMDYLGGAAEGFKTLKDEENLNQFNEKLQSIAKEINLDLPDEIIPGTIEYSTLKAKKNGTTFCCASHGQLGNCIEVPSFVNVFASTASRLFEELRKPIRDILKGVSQEINQLYLSTKTQKLALLPLEEIQAQLKIKSKELEAAVREAELILANI